MTVTKNSRFQLVRRIRDVEGHTVTYLSLAKAAEATGISDNRIMCWYHAGVIRSVPSVKGSGRGYALVDIARIRFMSPAKRKALGIRLTPERNLQVKKEWYENVQRETHGGQYHFEEWDDYDITFVLEEYQRGTSTMIIAKALGRTWAAVENRIAALRQAGDLPPIDRGTDEWKTKVLELLTPEEIASLLEEG